METKPALESEQYYRRQDTGETVSIYKAGGEWLVVVTYPDQAPQITPGTRFGAYMLFTAITENMRAKEDLEHREGRESITLYRD